MGIATATPMANEVSQAEARFGVNPSLAMVCTSDITNDITMAMIAGSGSGCIWGRGAGLLPWFLREGLRS